MKKLLMIISILFAKNAIAQEIISGNITINTTLTNDKIYLISGWVYVKSPATLTIQEGTILKGEKSTQGTLIIERGAKLIANGTQTQPIIFTSDQQPGQRSYGDWGGIILCGKASVNLPGGEGVVEGGTGAMFGGVNDSDNSGILRYVRIEFPGIPFQPNQEINGLTLGGVGSGTIIDHIQISYSGDDSYEWFGGSVNAKYLVAFRGWDDDFDTDNGFTGKLQYGVGIRDAAIADQSGSNGFESDNDGSGTSATPQTHPIFSNFSIFGPLENQNTNININFKRAAHLRRNTATNIHNSLIAGYPVGLLIDASTTELNADNDILQFKNNIISGCDDPGAVISSSLWDVDQFISNGQNRILSNTEILSTYPINILLPSFVPSVGSPLLYGSDFSNFDSFFDSTSFVGAFGLDDWTEGWTNWDPQNTDYNSVGINDMNLSISNISIYPNPSSQLINIAITGSNSNIDISVFDINGRFIYNIYNGVAIGNKLFSYVGESSGIYFLRISTNYSNKYYKFVIK